jgi:hypothetical protein
MGSASRDTEANPGLDFEELEVDTVEDPTISDVEVVPVVAMAFSTVALLSFMQST